jgi:hypothetical protein
MPVGLDGPDAEPAWLSGEFGLDGALDLARPLPDGRLEAYTIDQRINSSRVEGVDQLAPLRLAGTVRAAPGAFERDCARGVNRETRSEPVERRAAGRRSGRGGRCREHGSGDRAPRERGISHV